MRSRPRLPEGALLPPGRVERLELATKGPLYVVSALEPLIALLIVLGAQGLVRPAGVVLLFVVVVPHTIACVWLLRAGIEHRRGTPPPSRRLVGAAVALTLVGVAAGVAAFPVTVGLTGDIGPPAFINVTSLVGSALTAALAPVLRASRLAVLVAVPVVALGVAQTQLDPASPTLWAMAYGLFAGPAAFSYGTSVWVLRVVWELEQARRVQGRLAVAEERLRFARDLHDTLGRNLAGISVTSELAARLTRDSDSGAAERMLEVRALAQDSMREMREVIGGYRRANLNAELANARSLLASAGIDGHIRGDADNLPQAVQEALAWVVREAVTNVVRHASATTVTIDLGTPAPTATPAVTLAVENDGAVARPDGTGNGLAGLRERLSALGGSLTCSHVDGARFRLEACLPLLQRTPSPETVL